MAREGRFVFVVQKLQNYLTLCEVQVYLVAVKKWSARKGPPGEMPRTVKYSRENKAFLFKSGGEVCTVPVKTNPVDVPDLTFEMWVKVIKYDALGWVMAQGPDIGWSRALTVNDNRIGYISVTVGAQWNSELEKPEVNQWFHLVGSSTNGSSKLTQPPNPAPTPTPTPTQT